MIKKLPLLLTTLAIITAPNAFAFGKHEDDVKLENIQQIPDQILNFPLKDLNGKEITEEQIVSSIIYSVLNNSQYQITDSQKNYTRDETMKNMQTGQKFQKHVNGTKQDFSGVLARYEPETKTIKVIYTNETKDSDGSFVSVNGDSSSHTYKDIIFDIILKFDKTPTGTKVTETLPTSYAIDRSDMFELISKSAVDTPENLYADLSKVANQNNIIMPQLYILTTEVDNKYDPSTIYGNFERLMTKYDWASSQTCDPIKSIEIELPKQKAMTNKVFAKCDNPSQSEERVQQQDQAAELKQAAATSSIFGKIMSFGNSPDVQIPQHNSQQTGDSKSVEKYAATFDITSKQMDSTYNYKLNDENIPVVISAYPYRGQSKVSYKALIPYTINGSGTNSLTKEQIKNLEQSIEKIINS